VNTLPAWKLTLINKCVIYDSVQVITPAVLMLLYCNSIKTNHIKVSSNKLSATSLVASADTYRHSGV